MVQTPLTPDTRYPDSDGKPLAENTVQYRWIVRLVTNLKRLLKDQVAFVAGDLLWYPVEVETGTPPAQAPDAMVVLGRPDRDRGSYKQWVEAGIAPQVVFEILSPSNTAKEMLAKQIFYEKYGVLEMFFYDPEDHNFWGYARQSPTDLCNLITPLSLPWTSPTLGIRFELFEEGLAIFYPDGEPFRDPGDFADERDQFRRERDQFRDERDRALAKLRELGIDPSEL